MHFHHWVLFCMQGFGVGRLPKMPGTYGTLLAVPLVLLGKMAGTPCYVGILIAAFVFGVWGCGLAEKTLQQKDPASIVWDEIVGFMLAMAFVPATWLTLLVGFALFRLFDIKKPWPIGKLQNLPKGWGVMMDDVAAGLLVGVLLLVIF